MDKEKGVDRGTEKKIVSRKERFMKFKEFIKKVLKTLNESRVKYAIIGGVAAIYYGRPRTTMDLDVVVLLKERDIERFVNILKKNGFEVEIETIREAFNKRAHVSIFLKDSPYRIDVKGVYSSLDEASLKRRKKVKIFNVDAWIESPEDLIIAKLVYGSPQDIEDVKAILLRQRKLNREYLVRRGKEEKVLSKLKRLLKVNFKK